MRRSIISIQLFLFILLIGTLTLRSVRIGDYQSYPASRNRLSENERLLFDIIGNWDMSQSRIANSQYPTYFDEYRINWNITMFNHPVFELIGNGVLDFNLTANNKEIELFANQSLLFHWMDFGDITDATYIGVDLWMRTDSGELNQIYIGKQFYGNFINQSKALLKFASPIIPLGQFWEQWGIELQPFFSYWSTETLTLVDIMYIHQVTISYHGPRFVRYSQPLLVEALPKQSISEEPFLGIFGDKFPENEMLLIDIIGNWVMSQSRIANSQYPTYFDECRINWNITMFNHPVFELIGNGVLDFNLTTNNKEIELFANQSLLFHWMDFGDITDATYIGVDLWMRTDSGELNQIYIGKQFYGNFINQSKALLKFASPIIPLGQFWEQWGIELQPFFSYWSTETLTLVDIMYIHQVTISYHGPRFVRYTQPLIVERFPPFAYEYPFLKLIYYQSDELITSETTSTQLTEEPSTSQTTTTQSTEDLSTPKIASIKSTINPTTTLSTLTQIPLITFGFSWIVSIILLSVLTLHRLKKKKKF